MERRRTITPAKPSIRKELEAYVVAYNTVLRKYVEGMSDMLLLQNAHPSYRLSYAAKLAEIGRIDESQIRKLSEPVNIKPFITVFGVRHYL